MSIPAAPATLVVQDVHSDAVEALWAVCLELLALRRSGAPKPAAVDFVRSPEGRWVLVDSAPAKSVRLVVDLDGSWGTDASKIVGKLDPAAALFSLPAFRAGGDPILAYGGIPPSELAFLSLYLPALLGGWGAKPGRPFVLGHLAQSIDGRIACENGQSQWISNTANLHHAHRLRALHDGVVVGARTVAKDNPRLDVRHVRGDSPRRVLLSGSGSVLALDERHVFDGAGSVVVVRRGAAGSGRANAELLELDGDDASRLAPRDVTRRLGEQGLGSLFIEGGGTALSSFLENDAVDVLHLHIAPIVLGSGVPGFQLPAIDRVGRAPRFAVRHFLLDGELLMECRRIAGDDAGEGPP